MKGLCFVDKLSRGRQYDLVVVFNSRVCTRKPWGFTAGMPKWRNWQTR
jgi:hypothetical protein